MEKLMFKISESILLTVYFTDGESKFSGVPMKRLFYVGVFSILEPFIG